MKRTVISPNLLILISGLTLFLASCGPAAKPASDIQNSASNPSSTEKEMAADTPTPYPFEDWDAFSDEEGQFSLKYPTDWFFRPAEEKGVGKPSYISTFDLSPQYNEYPGEIYIPEGELLIAIGLETQEVIKNEELFDWLIDHFEFVVEVESVKRQEHGGFNGVVINALLRNDVHATSYFIATDSGVYFIRGMPHFGENISLFEMVISTLIKIE